MSDTKAMYGWDLLYSSVESEITKKTDVLIALVHWYLTKFGFRCIGIGSEKAFDNSEVGSEKLPSGWNTITDGNYALRYINYKILYVLCGTRTGEVLVLNLLRCSDYAVSSVTFKVEPSVHALNGPLDVIVPNYQNALNTIKYELIVPVFEGGQREVHTQTTEKHSSLPTSRPRSVDDPVPDPLRIGRPRRDISTGFESDPFSVGRSDLDPLGRAGGGMLFNPFVPGGSVIRPGTERLPRGAVPPGARFDPYGPVLPGQGHPRPGRGQPDPDHLPPPGYDDMFM